MNDTVVGKIEQLTTLPSVNVSVEKIEKLTTHHLVDASELSPLLGSELYEAMREVINRIERCGASVELTHAVTLASDLLQAIGNRWNPPDKYAAQRVRAALPPKP
jgi:hypothetical protein